MGRKKNVHVDKRGSSYNNAASDEEVTTEPRAPPGEDAESGEGSEDAPKAKKDEAPAKGKKGGKKVKAEEGSDSPEPVARPRGGGFAALADDDEGGDDAEEEDDEPAPVRPKKSAAPKGKNVKPAVEQEDEEEEETPKPKKAAKNKKVKAQEEEEEDDEEEAKPAKGKAKKGKKAKPVEDDEDEEEDATPKAKAKKSPAPGKKPGGGAFAALADDNEDEEEEAEEPTPRPVKKGGFAALAVEGEDEEDEEEEEKPKPKKGAKGPAKETPTKPKKGAKPAPVEVEEDEEDEAPKATPKGKKGKGTPQKGKGGFAALADEDEDDEEPEHETPSAKGKKGAARGGFAALADDNEDEEEEEKKPSPKKASAPAPAPAPAAAAKKDNKKKKGKKDEPAEEEDWEKILEEERKKNEVELAARAAAAPPAAAPAPAPAAAADAKKADKKKKKKGKKGGKDDEDDEGEEAPAAATPPAGTPTAETPGAEDEESEEEAGEGDAKKKDKKKKKKKAGEKEEKKQKKPKAILAAIAADREAKEAIEREQREKQAALDAAAKLAAEEEARQEAEKDRRAKQREADRLAGLEKGVKPMSKAERARHEKDLEYRRQLEAQGKIPAKGAGEQDVKKKKVVYAKKKKGAAGKEEGSPGVTPTPEGTAAKDFPEGGESDGEGATAPAPAPAAPKEKKTKAAWDESSSEEEAAAPAPAPAPAPKGAGKEPAAPVPKAAPAPKAAGGEAPDIAPAPAPAGAPKRPPKADKAGPPKEGDSEDSGSEEGETEYRSPICCVLGHVDTGKTSLLDKIRRTNVQGGEAGGITQQIGATFMPMDAIQQQTVKVQTKRELKYELPGLLVIDTPGHESFSNLRSRGASLCDIAVLVVDIMHGLEPQTIESMNLLRKNKCPFVVALNKVDRCYDWVPPPASKQYTPIRQSLKKQKDHTIAEFNTRLRETKTLFAEQGFNAEVYYENPDPRHIVSLIPTSATTGEGIPDLLLLLVQLTQKMMLQSLELREEVEATVLEVKVIDGLGTTVDVILVNGTLHEGDEILVCGLDGPIQTRIKALLTPQPMKEMRVKSAFIRHPEIKAAIGVKINAPDLEKAVAGTPIIVVQPDDDVERLKREVMKDVTNLMDSIDRTGEGVFVKASTLGAMEALLSYLKDMKVPVCNIGLGPVHLRDVKQASIMHEKNPVYACILAFNVPIAGEVQALADEMAVRIFPAEIIYHLFDAFTRYMDEIKARKKEAARLIAVFPCVLKIVPDCVFNNKNPIVCGVEVAEGVLKLGTPLCVPTRGNLMLGRVSSIELNHNQLQEAKRGEQVAIKIDSPEHLMVGRQFEEDDTIYSHITRESIDALKEFFRDEMHKDWWNLIQKQLKPIFKIQ